MHAVPVDDGRVFQTKNKHSRGLVWNAVRKRRADDPGGWPTTCGLFRSFHAL